MPVEAKLQKRPRRHIRVAANHRSNQSGRPICRCSDANCSRPRHLCELGRRPGVCGLALQDDRQDIPAVHRGRKGIRGARRHHDGLFLGQRDGLLERQLL